MKSGIKKRPNRLFQALVIVSLAVHGLIFMHISGLYRSKALTYIELTLQDISKPPERSVPRPRYRPKEQPKVKDIKRLNLTQRPVPAVRPLRVEPVDRDLPDTLVEKVGIPGIPPVSGVSIDSWAPPKEKIDDEYASPDSYLSMVKLKIENQKRYPEEARHRQIEGRVMVKFVITAEGDIKALEIMKKSRSLLLDEAAIKAVKDAAPFPRPPKKYFKGEIALVITVVFDLT